MQQDYTNSLTINYGYYNGDISLLTKIHVVKPMAFPLVIYGCESWNIKKAEWSNNCGVGENNWESLGLQDIKPVNPKGNQSWIFIGRTDAKAEAPTLRPPNVKSWLIGKIADVGKIGGKSKVGVRGWDGYVSSPTQWAWVCTNSGR